MPSAGEDAGDSTSTDLWGGGKEPTSAKESERDVRERGRRNARGAKQRSADAAAVTAGETFALRQCRPQP
jgi:hypothetical protein